MRGDWGRRWRGCELEGWKVAELESPVSPVMERGGLELEESVISPIVDRGELESPVSPVSPVGMDRESGSESGGDRTDVEISPVQSRENG